MLIGDEVTGDHVCPQEVQGFIYFIFTDLSKDKLDTERGKLA